ncbi:uncharacterized protein HMPREF1541_05784 [Cyphellophora europaea CBS 101466]|uniref:Protein-S-isoprenylcysteine O-methyltransferase n=1 Tax=Cyphellophora europaea (strain CBS 101466) TaxID=1220924 RepID=W2RUW8_CYPE1|nr:uncharacterized protein HMPREF1541_05784 [Cyphellophora europaea CBS 101466]ETN39558.1 hypothetical protein HMPREF1541_05784 [Cyphellophora europaea CBS 101466]
MPQTRSRSRSKAADTRADHDDGPEHRANGSTTRRSRSPSSSSSPVRSPLYHPRYAPTGPAALTSIALQALFLGAVLSGALLFSLQLAFSRNPLWRLPFFVATCTLFHFLEFWCTARWNPAMADRSSFLIVGNGAAQGCAYLVALVEVAVRELVKGKGWWSGKWEGVFIIVPNGTVTVIGMGLIVLGQMARSMAMREAGASFNHLAVQYYKREDHILVTSGIFSWVRHPSYFGFFYWALGTQLVLGNSFSFLAYTLVLWRFFSHRVMHEERYLISFFGDDYRNYRERTPTWIPLVG